VTDAVETWIVLRLGDFDVALPRLILPSDSRSKKAGESGCECFRTRV